MGSEWKEYSLGEIVVTNDSTYSPKEAWEFVNYLDTSSITENRVNEIQYLDAETEKIPSRARRKVSNGDIVYSNVRPNQKHYGLIRNQPENFLVSTGFTTIRANPDVAVTEFLYWYISQPQITELLQGIGENTASAYPSIKPSDIENLQIQLPPLPEQKAIAHILGTLDDKIELNRRMNATLEGMAQALFKSWFVDFDPVLDNAILAGNPIPEEFAERAKVRRAILEQNQNDECSMMNDELKDSSIHHSSLKTHHSPQAPSLAAGNPIPDELAPRAEVRKKALANGTTQQSSLDHPTLSDPKSLFPAAFEFTEELGWIPEGWEVKTIDEVAEKIGMGPFGSRITRDNFVAEGVPVIRGGNLTDGFVDKDFVYLTEDKATELSSSNVFSGDIVFTHRGTIGQVGIIPEQALHPRYVVSQSQMFLRINKEITTALYAYRYFVSGPGMERLLGYASQVGVPAIARPTTSLKSLPILIPSKQTVEAFESHAVPHTTKVDFCNLQSEKLTKLRDTLLPKLISGELETI